MMMRTHSSKGKGTTLNISPPKVMMKIWPRAIINMVRPKPRLMSLLSKPLNAESIVW